ncbi:hypothetical protein [Streptomyces sp. NPDC057460]|uniref:hypothetical protein n=1 Tax=Streptomyces sp. NPDC057460 TaxID=3346141 RepID=UPI00368FFDE3
MTATRHGRLVADGELVVSRGQGSVALEAIVPRAWAEWCFVVDLLGAAAMVFMS